MLLHYVTLETYDRAITYKKLLVFSLVERSVVCLETGGAADDDEDNDMRCVL